MLKHTFTLFSLTLCMLCASQAMAQEQATVADKTHKLSITISPLKLISPIVEFTGEYAVTPSLGVAVILGGGQITSEDPILGDTKFTVLEAGVSGRYYVLGDFDHGMQVGAQALWINVSGDINDTNIEGSGQGLGVGPFIGYKWTASYGLTIDLQLGAQAILVGAEASDGEETATASQSSLGPLLNLNAGWSF